MRNKLEQSSAMNPNPVLTVEKDGTVLYSNEAGEPLLIEWGTKTGEKLPSSIGDHVQRVIAQNNPEKIEVKAGNRVFLVVFSPLPKQECINISGFDISDQKEVEGKLRENENKYRNIVETSVEGIWIFNAVSETTYINEKMAEMLGYNPEEMIGRFIWDFAYEEDKDIFQVKLANRKQGIDEVYELKLIRKDGSPLLVSVSAKGFFDDAGKFEGSVGMFTDITDSKRAEEALRQSKARVESIFRSSPVGIGVIVDRMIKEANERLCEMTGYSREELLGKSALMLYPTAEEYEHVGQVKYGMIEESGIGSLETRWQRKDGSVVDILLSSSPIVPNDLSGEITFTAMDITERKRAEEALRESEEKYRIVADNTFDWEFWLGPDGHFQYMSPSCERVTGYAVLEFLDNPDLLQEIIHSDDRQAFLQHKHDTSPSRHGDIEFRIITKDGEIRWIHHLCQPIYDGNGCYAGNRGSNRDVTERKRTEETLAFERSQFLSIFDGMDDVVYVADPYTYEVLYANKAMKEKFGGELVGGICYREFQRKESPCNFCTNPIILKERSKPYNWEYYNPMVDRFFIIMDRIIRWPDGRDVRLEIAKDITERRKTEEALKKAHENLEEKVKERTVELEEAYSSLKKSEGRLAEAQRIAHLGNWDWNTVTNELYWSDEVYRIFGCSPQEFGATYDAFLSYVHPDDLEYVNNAVIEALNGKSYRIDHRIILANGEERMIHEQGEVIFDEKNTPVRMVGTVQDITEHKKAAEKIQMLADVVESSNDTIVTRTLDGIVTSWNKGAEQMHGYSADEIIGKKITIMEPDDRKGELFRLAEKVKHGEKIKNYETVRLKKDGTRLNVSITLSPVFDSSGKLIAISTIARDITDRIKAEEALSKTEEARRKEIHHRIKNNLQVISSLLDLQAEKFRDKEVLEAFRESQSRVISMSLIHEELYKGEGTDKLDFSAYLQMLAKNLFHTYDLGSKNIRLYMDLAENAFFNMDIAVPLGIIVNELISNSLKHAFKGRDKGEIRIRLHRENVEECKIDGHKNTNFTLTVSDDGIGISENLDIKSIDSLGLQLVISLVEQLDGSLELKRNHGTEFIIRFTVRGNDDQELMPAVQRSIE